MAGWAQHSPRAPTPEPPSLASPPPTPLYCNSRGCSAEAVAGRCGAGLDWLVAGALLAPPALTCLSRLGVPTGLLLTASLGPVLKALALLGRRAGAWGRRAQGAGRRDWVARDWVACQDLTGRNGMTHGSVCLTTARAHPSCLPSRACFIPCPCTPPMPSTPLLAIPRPQLPTCAYPPRCAAAGLAAAALPALARRDGAGAALPGLLPGHAGGADHRELRGVVSWGVSETKRREAAGEGRWACAVGRRVVAGPC